MAYRDTYLTDAGKIEQVSIEDTNDTNCQLVTRLVKNLTDDEVEIEGVRVTPVNTRSKKVCQLANTDHSKPNQYEWPTGNGANNYVELPIDIYVPATDADAKALCKVWVQGRKYHLDNALPRDAWKFDRTTNPVRIEFKAGVIANRNYFIEMIIEPNTT